jgi:hypothetical protein
MPKAATFGITFIFNNLIPISNKAITAISFKKIPAFIAFIKPPVYLLAIERLKINMDTNAINIKAINDSKINIASRPTCGAKKYTSKLITKSALNNNAKGKNGFFVFIIKGQK